VRARSLARDKWERATSVSKVIFDIGNMLIRREGARSRSRCLKSLCIKSNLAAAQTVNNKGRRRWRARRSQGGERANYFYHEILMKGPATCARAPPSLAQVFSGSLCDSTVFIVITNLCKHARKIRNNFNIRVTS
jgi:hypothetical protein